MVTLVKKKTKSGKFSLDDSWLLLCIGLLFLLFITTGHLLTFAKLIFCFPLASKNSYTCHAVTEMWWSSVTWDTRELFLNSGSEEICNWSNFLHPASDIPLTVCLLSCGPSSGFVCLIRACCGGAYCLCKPCNTMALISQMHGNDWESM